MKHFLLLTFSAAAAAAADTPLHGLFEAGFQARNEVANPYAEQNAQATLTRPDGSSWRVPLFWDGGRNWKLRVSPDLAGKWSYRVASPDPGLNGAGGSFVTAGTGAKGGLRAAGSHFERQNGDKVWFLADTAWGYFTDSPADKHDRRQAEHYARTRAGQGFNAIHCMLLSEQGVGNNAGLPFSEMKTQRLNPAYFREVDERLAFANQQGLTVGIAIAWGDKRKQEPFAWRMFPDLAARKRFAQYVAARYSAYDVFFLVSGEWHGELRTRDNAVPDEVFREFVEIGDAVDASDPHGRMIGIHPMSAHGSVREFAAARWMSFADYQQNYNDLHARALLSRGLRGPVVNSEYGYFLRDSNGDGVPDKDNSYTLEDMRFATWDLAMAGAYAVTGFGTTYFGGHRDPGPFDVDAPKNDDWERQYVYVRKFFESLPWTTLIPADELLRSPATRQGDRRWKEGRGAQPPGLTYWALANPGELYVAYVRGTTEPVHLSLGARPRKFKVRRFDPRSGEFTDMGVTAVGDRYSFSAPDTQDWLVVLEGVR
jgi:hypothetical protein